MQKSGWTSYENNQEGFRISYPLRFKMTEIIQNKLLEFVDQNTLKGPDGYLYFNLSLISIIFIESTYHCKTKSNLLVLYIVSQ